MATDIKGEIFSDVISPNRPPKGEFKNPKKQTSLFPSLKIYIKILADIFIYIWILR